MHGRICPELLPGEIKSGDDLVWYGRVETERHYKGDDPEVEAAGQSR